MLAVLLLLIFGVSTQAYPDGAPSNSCVSLTPDHGVPPQSSSLPYSLDLSVFYLYGDGYFYYEPGKTYQCEKDVI